MEYKIVVETHAGQKVIHTYITGDLSVEKHDRIGAETIKALEDNKITKTIWDLHEAKLNYSLTRIHLFVTNAKSSGLKDSNYCAVIYNENYQREYEHAKIVGKYQGLTNLNYFQDRNEGINWLISLR